MRILKAKKEDLEILFELHHDTTKLHESNLKNYFKTLPKDKELKYLESIFRDKNKTVYFAKDNDNFVGYIVCGYIERWGIFKNPKVGFIESIGVKKEYRNQRIATKLIEKSIKWFKDQGYTEVDLNVFDFNQEAFKLYEKQGFSTLRKIMTKKI